MITDRLNTALADRYRIEKQLGQGGMATVYLAQDLRHARKVAMNVLKPELYFVLWLVPRASRRLSGSTTG